MKKLTLFSILISLPVFLVSNLAGDATKTNGKVVLIKGPGNSNENLTPVPDNQITVTIEGRRMMIDFFQASDNRTLIINDNDGKTIYQTTFSDQTPRKEYIDMDAYNEGAYSLFIKNENEILAYGEFSLVSLAGAGSDWSEYLEQESIFHILADGNILWIATNEGLVKFDKQTEKTIYYTAENSGLSDNHLRTISKDKEGNLWIGTQFKGINKFIGSTFESYDSNNSGLISDQHCRSIVTDESGNLWIGSLLYLNKFDGKNWQFWTTPGSEIAAYYFFNDLKIDKDGVLWIGLYAPGQYLASFSGGEIQPVKEMRSTVNAIEIDENNHKWLATNQGLVRYDGNTFVSYNTENSSLPSDSVYCISRDLSGNLWMICGWNLVKFDGENFISYEIPVINQGNLNYIFCIEPDNDGNIWIGTRKDGLIKYAPGLPLRKIDLRSSGSQTSILIPNLENEISISLYPNPVINTLYFETNELIDRVDIMDMTGRSVQQTDMTMHEKQVDVSRLNRGMYIVTFSTSDKKMIARKICISN